MVKDALLKSETFRTEYLKWLEMPVTQMVIDILRQEGRVMLPPSNQIRAENGLVEAAKNVGWFNCLDRLMSLNEQHAVNAEPVADFGAANIAQELGIKIIPGTKKGTDNEQ